MKNLMGLVGLIFLFGCATSSHVLTGSVHPEISPDAVKIYHSMPPGAQEIALVDGADPWRHKMDRAISSMKKKAARIGANGILIDRTSVDAWYPVEINGRAIYVP